MLGREGMDNDGDGLVNEDEPDPLGTVTNRNYPVGWWSQDELMHGRGRYPLSEPESKAQVDFVLAHPNINGITTYHTHSGLILRSYSHRPDDIHIHKDLPYYEGVGETGAEITGYPLVSTITASRPIPYVLGWERSRTSATSCVVSSPGPSRYRKAPGEEGLSAFEGLDEIKMLKFIDEELGGEAFVPWKPYDHPVYGEVEIGGLQQNFVIQNPPPMFLEQEIEKVTKFAIVQGLMSPLVRVVETSSEDLGGGIFRVRASIQNQGYLPTALERAKTLGLAKPVTVVLEGGEVLSEPTTHSLGTLTGWGPARGNRPSYNSPGAPIHDVSWVVRGKAGDQLTVGVRSERGGRHQVQMLLGK